MAKDPEATPLLTKWLDAIQRMLKEEKKSIADFAREINVPEGQYIQVYRWLAQREVAPRGEAMLAIVEWALRQEPAGRSYLQELVKLAKESRQTFSR